MASKSPLLLLHANSPVVIHIADTCTARVPTRLGLNDTALWRTSNSTYWWRRNAPTKVLGLTGVTQLAAGGYHTLALHGDNTVSSFGKNNYGQ